MDVIESDALNGPPREVIILPPRKGAVGTVEREGGLGEVNDADVRDQPNDGRTQTVVLVPSEADYREEEFTFLQVVRDDLFPRVGQEEEAAGLVVEQKNPAGEIPRNILAEVDVRGPCEPKHRSGRAG